ncbi:Zn(II)2Cys6 transcription factor [Aspergillus avenaceus]|uniref:Zn(II)2Cys6 transcription factor n=1 Tax=Aspergillus avenaceus TaxID=36643 RepID=A0A5N6U0B8_ASPAV|nr:Zn(II)2Cys6 transcription factor [Aspergillus avenaceus]
MPIRRPHRKSRHGCKSCKRRRVKCDESRPVCSHCQQRQEVCDYTAEVPYIWATEGKSSGQRGRSRDKSPSQSDSGVSPTTGASFDILDRFGAGTVFTATPSLDMNQLRLIVQWQKETHRLFARNEETRHVWQVLIVDEALNVPFLMHGVLAVAALHLALCGVEPQRASWLALATSHKGQALNPFLERLNDVRPENAKAMLGFAGLVVAFAFGSALTGVADADQPSLDTLNNIFVLCRGVQQITNSAFSHLRQSSFAPLFAAVPPPTILPDAVKNSLDHLDMLNATCGLEGDHDVPTYEQVIRALRDLSAYTYAQPTSMTMAAGWAIRTTPSYLEYIQRKEPLALVVHAHYCAFLHLARGNWFLQSWGSCVLRDIYQLLSSEWRTHIQWPVHEVFGDDLIF